MKKGKSKASALFICYNIAAVCFYISAALRFTSGDGSDAALHLCLGAAFTVIALMYYSKGNKSGDSDSDSGSDNGNGNYGNNSEGDGENNK